MHLSMPHGTADVRGRGTCRLRFAHQERNELMARSYVPLLTLLALLLLGAAAGSTGASGLRPVPSAGRGARARAAPAAQPGPRKLPPPRGGAARVPPASNYQPA